ncbi:MAG: DMT family transporter [Mycobacteriales bacterium]
MTPGPGPRPDRERSGAGSPAVPVALAATLLGGTLFALQGRLNGELADRAGSALWAALVSFGSGLVVVGALVAAVPATRRAVRPALANRLPWWTYCGGLSGATVVTVAALAVPVVGVATFTVGLVAGQAVGGLVVDRSRLGPGGPRPLSPARVGGAAVAVLAVLVIRLGHGTGPASAGAVLGVLLASSAAGAGLAVQQALNGRVQRATGSALIAGCVNFLVGTVALVLAFGAALLAGAGPDRWWPGPAGLYAGGTLGVVYITVAAWAVRGLGVLRLALSTVAGQLAGGLLIDLVSPGRAGGVDAATLAGVVLTLAGVALAGRRAAQSRSRPRTSSSETAAKTTR